MQLVLMEIDGFRERASNGLSTLHPDLPIVQMNSIQTGVRRLGNFFTADILQYSCFMRS